YGTADFVRGLELPNMPVRLVREPGRGVGAARNASLRAARGEILLVTDDDTRLPAHWIGAMCRPIRAGEADAVAGKVALAEHLQRPWMEPFHRAILSSTECLDEEDPQDMFGASMAFSRRVLERVPAFDPELGPGTEVGALEDTLFTWQLKAAGYRIGFVGEAVVEHHFDPSRLSRSSLREAAKRHGQARAYMAYHWQHGAYARSRWVRPRRLNLLVRYGLLTIRRGTAWREWGRCEGITRWEFGLIRQINGIKQHLKESRRPPNYDRRGLVKKRGTLPPAPSPVRAAPRHTR